jgi:hypothetical protein
MRFSALLLPCFIIVAGLIQAAPLQRAIVRDDEVELRSSSLYSDQSILLSPPPVADAAIRDFSIPTIITGPGSIVKTLQSTDLKEFQDQLELALSRFFKELKKEFSEPLPEDKTEQYKQQETKIIQTLETIEDSLVYVCKTWNIPEDTVRANLDKVKPHLRHFLLVVTNLFNNHPALVLLLYGLVIIAIIPVGFILFRWFIRFLGFGLLGPVKGSIAACNQSPKVLKGGLYARLQSLGMKTGGIS